MAKLGLIGAIGGLGQGLQTFGADLVRRREQALRWAQEEARYQRERADKKSDMQTEFEQTKEITNIRETQANVRNQADIEARAADRAEERKFRAEDREDEQSFKSTENKLDRQAQLDRERTIEALKQADDEKSIRLRNQVEADDVAGVKYGEKYSINPRSGRPYSDPNSPYAELLLVKKNGDIVHTGKLILAPQNRSGQDDPNDPYG